MRLLILSLYPQEGSLVSIDFRIPYTQICKLPIKKFPSPDRNAAIKGKILLRRNLLLSRFPYLFRKVRT